MGDVVGTRLANRGVVGIVSGSGIRDLDGLRELGLTAFALGAVVSHGVFTIAEVGVDVEVAGLQISSGDLLHGNADGLVSVPHGRPAELLTYIAAVQAKELASRTREASSAEATY
jgi:4-hydroxy-4-methyl-2-oxoglutarate aldolase